MNKKTFTSIKALILFLQILLLSSCTSEYYVTNVETRKEFVDELNDKINREAMISLKNNTKIEGKFLSFQKDSISVEIENEKKVNIQKLTTDDILSINFLNSNGPKGAAIGLIVGAIIGVATEFVTVGVSNSGPHPDKGASFMFGGFIGAGLGIILGIIFYNEVIFYFKK